MISEDHRHRLEALSAKRAAHVRSLEENDDHSHRILAEELYGDPTHFLFELLQNAEDEGAKRVMIQLDEMGLSFTHDGRAFDVGDIESITAIGHNERKRQKRNTIGRFGIGFKSVFSVTSEPQIKSGSFRFLLRDYIVPEFGFDVVDDGKTTISLPFGEDADASNERYILLEEAVQEMDHRHLLFLRNVEEIQWTINAADGAKSGELVRTVDPIPGTNLFHVRVKDRASEQGFILGERPVTFANKDLSVKAALMVVEEEGKESFVQVDASPLFAFFPTTVETNLAFLVHAPFATTPARDNLQEREDGANSMLLDELAALLGDMVDELGKVERLDPSLWNILPCEKEHTKRSAAYASLYAGFANRARSNSSEWWKSTTGRHVNASGIQLSTSPAITSLFVKAQSEQLFGRGYWLATDWIKALDADVRAFLRNELKVPEIDMAALKDSLTIEFVQGASDDWMLKLYGCITSARAFADWEQEPIVRTNDGNHVAAFSKKKRLVFRPIAGGSDYPCVKESMASTKPMKEFMDGMRIKEPDIVDEVSELLIPKIRKKDQPYPQLKRHIARILEAVEAANDDDRKALIMELRGLRFLPARTAADDSQILARADECYYPSNPLGAYFVGSLETLWLDLDLVGDIAGESKFKKLLDALKVKCQPGKRTVPCHLDQASLVKITNDAYIRSKEDHDLDFLSEALENTTTVEASRQVWNALLGTGLPGKSGIRSLLFGKVIYGRWNTEQPIPSSALARLRETPWLFSSTEERRRPSELTLKELHADYTRTDAESAILVELLEFKADEASQFESDHPDKKVVDKREYEELMALKRERDAAQAKAEAQQKRTTAPLLDVGSVDGEEWELEDLVPTMKAIANLASEPAAEFTPVVYGGQTRRTGRTDYTVAIAPEQEDLGQWGEAYVAKILRLRCTPESGLKLVELNNEEMSGVGRDFQIHKDGKLLEVIEVKSTSYDKDAPVKLSRRQWEQAVKYHKAHGPVTYWVYCVYLANTRKPKLVKIKDPVAELERGRLIVEDLVIRLAQ